MPTPQLSIKLKTVSNLRRIALDRRQFYLSNILSVLHYLLITHGWENPLYFR